MQKTTFEKIKDNYKIFMEEWKNEHHRFRSYDPCKEYFDAHYGKEMTKEETKEVYNECALRLFYYLTSWGMLRNKDWFIWKSHKVFVPVVEVLFKTSHKKLWNINPLTSDYSAKSYATAVTTLYNEVYKALSKTLDDDDKKYPPKGDKENVDHKITQLLICKIIMGTYGCVIAYDQYDVKGMRAIGVTVSSKMDKLLENTYNIVLDNRNSFEKIMEDMKKYVDTDTKKPVNYTVFKVLDMILWSYAEKN